MLYMFILELDSKGDKQNLNLSKNWQILVPILFFYRILDTKKPYNPEIKGFFFQTRLFSYSELLIDWPYE